MQPLVETRKLKKNIDDFTLGPIDLRIEPGTVTALVGNNGSGKSTLLKLLMFLAKSDSGEIKIAGQPVCGEDESWKTYIAYQPQTIVGYHPFTGLLLRDMISCWYPDWDEALFRRMVDCFEVPLNKRFSKLSQGSQQKLILALTIARNTPILILDEPTAFMDIPAKRTFMDLLTDWMDQGDRAIIITSHQVEDIEKLADYLVALHNGKMLGNFEKEALKESYKRYWLQELPPQGQIPGEVLREERSIISDQPEETEAYLQNEQIPWTNITAMELDEIITLLLSNQKGRYFDTCIKQCNEEVR